MTKKLLFGASFVLSATVVGFFMLRTEYHPRTVESYRLFGDTEVWLSIGGGDTCNADFKIEVAETTSEVLIIVEATNGDGNDCISWPAIELESDLLDRRVVDASTGLEVRRRR